MTCHRKHLFTALSPFIVFAAGCGDSVPVELGEPESALPAHPAGASAFYEIVYNRHRMIHGPLLTRYVRFTSEEARLMYEAKFVSPTDHQTSLVKVTASELDGTFGTLKTVTLLPDGTLREEVNLPVRMGTARVFLWTPEGLRYEDPHTNEGVTRREWSRRRLSDDPKASHLGGGRRIDIEKLVSEYQ